MSIWKTSVGFFVSEGPTLSTTINASHRSPQMNKVKNTFALQQIDLQEVAKTLDEKKNKKSSGSEGIRNETLRWCSPSIESFIAFGFNHCALERTYPSILQITKFVPLHKKGEKSIPENYRPVSLLNSLRIFLMKYWKQDDETLRMKKLLFFDQYSFRPKTCCIDAIDQEPEYMRAKIDPKNTGQDCFIDLKKASGTLDHGISLIKMDY